MRNVTLTIMVTALLLLTTGLFALNGFERVAEIPFPDATTNNGGTGNMIAGVDVDEDGFLEIYLVNDNWNDGPTEVIPRIYKLEFDGSAWNVVWSAVIDPFYQNSWPCLSLADLDKDGKKELVWGPVNSFSVSTNPVRMIVYEHAGGDVFGVSDGVGGYNPNSTWTITETDNENTRLMDWEIVDIDSDGTDEIVFADRAGTTGGHFFGVCSVTDIPDTGDGSETWTLEVSGKDFTLPTPDVGITNKWDVAVIGSNAYFFCELEISKLSWDGSAWNYTGLSPMAGGSSVQSAQAVDLDEDGTLEIICAVYDWADDSKKAIMLLQEDGDTLKHTELINVSEYWTGGSRGPWGGALGDIDQDGHLDFVFGSRAGDVNARIFRCAYKGGDITSSANYELSIIDEAYGTDGIWSVINIANMDADPELEVVYTSSATMGGLFSSTAPIIVLDYAPESFTPGNLVVAADLDSIGMRLKPGRILDNGQTIWLSAYAGTIFGNQTYAFLSTDGGATFTQSAAIAGNRVAQLDAFDENIAVVATEVGSIWRTADGGGSWTEVHSYSGGWFDGLRVLNDDVAVAYGDGMYFCRSTDKGATWTEITGINYGDAFEGIYSYGMAACNVGETAWFAAYPSGGTVKYIFKTTDAGETWTTTEISNEIALGNLYGISFADENNGMANGNGKKPIYTTDGGATWDSCATNPGADESEWVNAVVAVPGENVFIALCDYSLYYTEDMGDTWIAMDTPVDDEYFISAVVLNKNVAYFMTQQGTAVTFSGESGIVGNNTKILDQYQLHQNFPNPFNPTTSISFQIPQTNRVKLVIYDIVGREVVSLVDNQIQSGSHSVIWNGKDKNGSMVSTGVYIYQLQADGITKTKKMTLMK